MVNTDTGKKFKKRLKKNIILMPDSIALCICWRLSVDNRRVGPFYFSPLCEISSRFQYGGRLG